MLALLEEVLALQALAPRDRIRLLLAVGGLHRQGGRPGDAREAFEAALVLSAAAGDRRSEGVALNNLGTLDSDGGRLDDALDRHEAALAIHRALSDRHHEGIALVNLGILLMRRRQPEAARARYEEALAVHRETGDRIGEGLVLCDLAPLEDERRAEVALARAATLLEESGALERGKLRCARARLLTRRERVEEARAALAEAEALGRALGSNEANELGRAVRRAQAALSAAARRSETS